MENDQFIRIPEMAAELKISRGRAYALVADGTIPAVKIGRSLRIVAGSCARGLRPTGTSQESNGEPRGRGDLPGARDPLRAQVGGRVEGL